MNVQHYRLKLVELTHTSQAEAFVKKEAHLTNLLHDYYETTIFPKFLKATEKAAKEGLFSVDFVVPRPSPFTKLFWKMHPPADIGNWVCRRLHADLPGFNFDHMPAYPLNITCCWS